MTRRIPATEARALREKATADWGADVSPSGVASLDTFVPDPKEPNGRRHVVLAEFRGDNDLANLALACNAHDLAHTVCELEAERDALKALVREYLARAEEHAAAREKATIRPALTNAIFHAIADSYNGGKISDEARAAGDAFAREAMALAKLREAAK